MKLLVTLSLLLATLAQVDAFAYGNWQDVQATATPYYVEGGINYNIEGSSSVLGVTGLGYWPGGDERYEYAVQEVTCNFTRLSAYTNAQITKVEIKFTQDGSGYVPFTGG